jgi:hypothetical protein
MPPHMHGQAPGSLTRKKIPIIRIQPYRQGRFDGLCALYAIVNTFRVCLGDHPRYDEIWPELFSFLVDGLASEVNFAEIMLSGLPPKAVPIVLANAIRFLNEERGVELTLERPFHLGEKPSKRALLAKLRVLSRRQNAALLIWIKLEGLIRHWTVINAVRARSVSLYDSAGYCRLRFSEIQMSYESTATQPGKYSAIIKPRRVFLVERV